MTTFVCPGSYDPITIGHLDVILRALPYCDRMIVAIGENPQKKSFFTTDEKLALLAKVFSDKQKIIIDRFTGLTVRYAEEKKASALIRGLRGIGDFEYEFQMAALNKKLAPTIETLFFMSAPEHSTVSSGAVRDFLRLGADIAGMVPDCVLNDIILMGIKKLGYKGV